MPINFIFFIVKQFFLWHKIFFLSARIVSLSQEYSFLAVRKISCYRKTFYGKKKNVLSQKNGKKWWKPLKIKLTV